MSQLENPTRRSRTRLQTARDFDCGRCKTFDDLSSRVILEPQSIWLIGLRISREIRILAHRNAYFSNERRDDDLRTSARLRISRMPRILDPVNFHRSASHSRNTRDDASENENLSIFIVFCCAQDAKV